MKEVERRSRVSSAVMWCAWRLFVSGRECCGLLGGRRCRRVSDAAGKVKAADDDAFLLVQAVGRLRAESAGDYSIRADLAADGSHAFLLQLVHSAFVVAACREEALFAFEYHSEICRERAAS